MKKQILIILVWTILIPFSIRAQVSNGDFEGWNTQTYSIPLGWDCPNGESISSSGFSTVSQVNGVTGSAVRMETMSSSNGLEQAFITIGDPMGGTGGFPFSQIPSSISGQYRYNLPGNDSAIILVEFKNSGVIISSDVFMIKGSGSQNAFTPFSFPLSVSSTPDTVVIAFASSNLIGNVGVQAGSWLELDDIFFAGSNISIPNSDFESWNTATLDNIIGWNTNGNVVKTTDSHTGTFAAQLTTIDYGNGNVSASFMTNGQNTQNGPSGGMPFTGTTDTLVGFYKYTPSGSDSASIGVNMMNNGNGVGGGGSYLPAAASYTYFEIPFSAMSTPDSIRIDISSSIYPTSPSSVASTLIIDDIQLKSQLSTGLSKVDNGYFHSGVYPNPADNYIYVRLKRPVYGAITLSLYDMEGRLLQSNEYTQREGDMRMNIADLSSGTYFYSVNGENYSQTGTFNKN